MAGKIKTTAIGGLAAIAATVICLSSANADVQYKDYYNPKIGGDRLDICFAKGQCERGRQLPADTYCKSKGYTNATNFNTEHSLKRTRKIGDGDRCTGACRRFSYIQCARTVKSNPNPNDPPNYGGGNSKDEIIGGIVGGIIGGIIAGGGNNNNQPQPAPQPQPQPAPQFSNAHYQYCLNKYSSYNISSNTYTSYSGQLRYCNSPYN